MRPTYFTTKVATEIAFCNRGKENQQLVNNIEKNQHSVVIGPRRYGKTSLVAHTLAKNHYRYARIDLFCVAYEEDICRKVAKGISGLLRGILSFSEKTLKLIEQCFKSAQISVKTGQFEIKVAFDKATANPVAQLEDLLEGLEKVATKYKQPVVLFFDEFQDVLKADASNKIQAAIRAVAQHSKYVTYIFSGSSRMMLNKIFDDKNQPLYMLCKKILLERISAEHFKKHIDLAAKNRWKSTLAEEITTSILSLTECHPYYVNFLCDKLWESPNKPTLVDVEHCWNESLSENKGKIIADLEPLNTNRLKVVTMVGLLGAVSAPNSKIFLDKVKLPLASTQSAVKYLLTYDYLHETKEGLKLTDPLLRKFIVERYSED